MPSERARDDALSRFREYRRTGNRRLRNELVEEHLGVTDYFVKKYSGRGVPEDDIRQVAFLGVLRAVERFDPEMGVAFSTFASRTIEGDLKRYFRDRTWSVRPPRRAQELHLEVRRAQEELAQTLGRSPDVSDLASHLDETEDHVLEALEASSAYQSASLDRPVAEDQSPHAAERRVADHEPGYHRVEVKDALVDLLDDLPERERTILVLRYFEGLSQPEIAERVGVSQSYLSRLLRRTLADVRAQLGEVESP